MTADLQANLYKFIVEYITSTGLSPSYAEMTAAMGISPRSKSLITRSLRALSKKGKIFLKKEGRRLLISLSSKELPIVGRVSAGTPIEAVADHHFIDMSTLFQGQNHFALQVKGNSMVEDGILEDDLIICRHTDFAKEGDIVVALIDQHNTTLKRISYKVKGMVTLIPSNIEMKPRAYLPERIQVQGVYVGLIRLNS